MQILRYQNYTLKNIKYFLNKLYLIIQNIIVLYDIKINCMKNNLWKLIVSVMEYKILTLFYYFT